MSAMSTYLGNALLNWLKGTDMPDAPAVYVGLYNGDPQSAGTEVTGTVSLTRQAPGFGSISARAMNNSAEINFGTASGSATVTHISLHDASTAGNLLSSKSITSAAISSSEKVAIAPNQLVASY